MSAVSDVMVPVSNAWPAAGTISTGGTVVTVAPLPGVEPGVEPGGARAPAHAAGRPAVDDGADHQPDRQGGDDHGQEFGGVVA